MILLLPRPGRLRPRAERRQRAATVSLTAPTTLLVTLHRDLFLGFSRSGVSPVCSASRSLCC
ncbi:hypothetical protein M8494_25275 [Serratia ureilytica]